MNSQKIYDVAVVGGGASGLATAAYLGKAGLEVVVLEKRFERGGTFASDDYSTPFTYNQAQMFVSLAEQMPVHKHFQLDEQLVRYIKPTVAIEVITTQSGTLSIGRGGLGLGRTFQVGFQQVTDAMAAQLSSPGTPADLLAELKAKGHHEAVRLAVEPLDRLVEEIGDQRAKIALRYLAAMCGFSAGQEPLGIRGGFAVAQLFSPNLVWGGTKNLANSLFRIATGAGAACHVSSGVETIERQTDHFHITCSHGRRVKAKRIVSTLDPLSNREIFGTVWAELGLDPSTPWIDDTYGTFFAHFGIKGRAPASKTGGEPAAIRIAGFESDQDVVKYVDTVVRGAIAERIAGHLTVTTAHDPSQASPGPYGPLNTLRFETFSPFTHPEGSWDRQRLALRKRCWEFCKSVWPELGEAVLLAQFSDSPKDIATRFGTTRAGTVRHGALRDQLPLLNQQSQSADVYLAGGSVYPGVPGLISNPALASLALCKDAGVDPWWHP